MLIIEIVGVLQHYLSASTNCVYMYNSVCKLSEFSPDFSPCYEKVQMQYTYIWTHMKGLVLLSNVLNIQFIYKLYLFSLLSSMYIFFVDLFWWDGKINFK